MQIRLIVHTLVFDDEQVLLLKRQSQVGMFPDKWDVPGGLLEFGEEPESGARRELLEEANLKVGQMLPYSVYSNIDHSKDTQFITIFFKANYSDGEVKLAPKEHSDFCWMKIKQALQLPLCPLVERVLTSI